ncbi:PDZ domain-containing protein [Paraburkholderia fungorum]|uniref:PDZ domain-containing protein n=1 Tax=Paraburkholderia fungorum TaxID=134537 RepID=UPI00402B31E1
MRLSASVDRNGPSAKSGLRAGDVILRVNSIEQSCRLGAIASHCGRLGPGDRSTREVLAGPTGP